MANPASAFQANAFQVDAFQVGGVITPATSLTITAQAVTVGTGAHIVVPSPIAGSAFQIDAFQNNAFQVYPSSSLTLLGLAPSMGRVILLPAGNLTLTGQTPLYRSARVIPAANLTLVGQTPTLATGVIILVPAAASVAAFQRDAFQNNAFQIVGNSGLLLDAPPINVVLGLPIPVGNLTLTAQTPIIGRARIVPAGALTLTGIAPTLIRNRVILVPLPGANVTQQQLPGFFFVESTSGQLQVPGGPFVDFSTQTGLVLNAFAPRVISRYAIPYGALTLTGIAPTLITDRAILVPAGALVLTAFAPTPVHGYPVPYGTLLLTGLTPDIVVTVGSGSTLPYGQLFITGLAPTIVADQRINVPTALLTINGQTLLVTVHFGPAVTDNFFDGWILMDG